MASALTSCGGMTSQEKEMMGKYYIPALSDAKPLLELNDENRAVMRAIRPGDLTFSVSGTWKVRDDSLIVENDPATIKIEEGDPAMMGTVAPRVAYPIVSFNETTLTLNRGGVTYDYHRRLD